MKKTKCPLFIFLVIFAYFDSHDLKRPDSTNSKFTQLKAPGVKILCVLYLRYNVAFTFK